jgi:predicted GNAT superfamily acetyltransferase
MDAEVIAQAKLVAKAAADRAGVEIRALANHEEMQIAARLTDEVWQADHNLMPLEIQQALLICGNYVSGAFAGDELIGVCFAFRAVDDDTHVHSHIAAVVAGHTGKSIGTAIKLHQRAWALPRGIEVIEWTFDPLVARNAAFNLNRLGASVARYIIDFYGPSDDAINARQPTDRLLARWDLAGPEAIAAASGQRIVLPADASDVEWIAIPADIEALRAEDPAAAAEWRYRIREALAIPMAEGARIIGYHPERGYGLRR